MMKSAGGTKPDPQILVQMHFSILISIICVITASLSHVAHGDIGDLQPWLVKTRRDLHRIPELGFQEILTSQYIMSILDGLNISYRSVGRISVRDTNIPCMHA